RSCLISFRKDNDSVHSSEFTVEVACSSAFFSSYKAG
ncbi:MAG: hypothetical protein ACI93H_000753, partial [Psychromonas sp.]